MFSLSSSGESSGQGDRFFEGLLNSRYLGQIRTRLENLESFSRSEPETDLNSKRALLFKTMSRWLADPVLLDKNLHVASLSPVFMPQRVAKLIKGDKVSIILLYYTWSIHVCFSTIPQEIWWEYMDSNRLDELRERGARSYDEVHHRSFAMVTRRRSPLKSDGLIDKLKRLPAPPPPMQMEPRSSPCPTPRIQLCVTEEESTWLQTKDMLAQAKNFLK